MQNIDIVIFIVFFIINLVVGILARGKKQTFREFAIGDKNFSTATLVATIVATWASGSMFFTFMEQTYTNGLYYVLPVTIGSIFSWLFIGYVLGPRMQPFLGYVSMAAALGSIYGKWVQLIAGLSTVLGKIGFVAVQFKVISKILSILFNYQGFEVTIIAAIIVIVYSAFGGIKAVTFTDVVQFITFGTLLPVLALAIWYHIPNREYVVNTLTTNPNFSLKQVMRWSPQFVSALVLWSYYAMPGLAQELFQRMAMAKNVGQIKRSVTYSISILIAIMLFIVWTAILLLTDNPNLTTSQVVSYMIEKYTFTGLKGFLGVGIIALAISSADSTLNSCSVVVANDILPPLKIIKQASVRVAVITTVVLGCFAILFTLYIQNLLQIILLSANFYVPIIVMPMLLTIFGFRTSKRSIFLGIGAGFVVTAVLLFYFKSINSFFPGIIANLTFLLGSHYLLREEGGFMRTSVDPKQFITLDGSFPGLRREERWSWIKNFKLSTYLEKQIPNKESHYRLLGFYLLTAAYFSLYSLPRDIQEHYIVMYRIIQVSILLGGTSLLSFAIWKEGMRQPRVLAWLWPTILLYVLFFIGAMVVLMSGFASHQIFIYLLSVLIAFLLTSWQLCATLASLGMFLAYYVFKHFMGGNMPGVESSIPVSWQIGYVLIAFSSLLIVIRVFKQANQELTSEHEYLMASHAETSQGLVKALNVEQRFVRSLQMEGIKELERTSVYSRALLILLNEYQKAMPPAMAPHKMDFLFKWIDDVQQRLGTTAKYLSAMVHRATVYLRVQPQKLTVPQLVEGALERVKLLKRDHSQYVSVSMQASLDNKTIAADQAKLLQLLENAITYAWHFAKSPRVLLQVEETELGYPTDSVQNHTKKVPAVCFTITTLSQVPTAESLYLHNMDKSVVNERVIDGYNVSLLLNQRILQAHYGFMAVEKEGQQVTQTYVIPQDVRAIRPKEMDILELDPDTELEESNENYPGAKEQEQALFDTLKLENEEQVAVVHKALRFIKRHHGPVKRKSGEPFYLHPVMVAKIARTFTPTLNLDIVLGGLLHDVVEDTAAVLSQVELMFSPNVKKIVDGVTHLDTVGKIVYRLKLDNYENITQLLEKEDPEVLIVKLADRTHNMRTIQFHKVEKQKEIAEETLLFFVPIAKFLGLSDIAKELQDMSNAVLSQKE